MQPAKAWMVLIVMLASLIMEVAPATAQTVQKEPGPLKCAGDAYGGNQSCNCRDRHEGFLLAVIIPCIRDEVQFATKRMTNEFSGMLQTTIGAFLTLVIAMFGVKILMAEGDPKKDTFVLLVKIGAVMAFMGSYDELIIDPAFGVMKEGVDLTTGIFNFTALYCTEELALYPNAEQPWGHYDCILGKLVGYAPETFVGASALGLAGSALVSGQFGSVFVMGVVTALFFLIKLVLRGAYTYLMAVMALGLLVFISPLLIPLIWMPATQQYFDRWLGGVIAMIVMPAIIMGYLSLSFIVLHQIVFDENIGIMPMLTKEKVQEMQMGPECSSQTVAADPATAGMNRQQMEDQSQFNWLTPILSGTGDSNLFSCFYHVDFRGGEAGRAGTLFFGFVSLIITAYILMTMLDAVIQMAQIVLGGGFFMQQAIIDNPFERGLNEAQRTLSSSMSQAAPSGSGPAGRMQTMAQNIAQGMARAPVSAISAMANPNVTRR